MTYRIRPTFKSMIESAAKFVGTTPEAITGDTRRAYPTHARRIVIWNARNSGYSLPEIGEALNRHHRTILYHCREMGCTQ